jgi:NAD-dependent deacetylase
MSNTYLPASPILYVLSGAGLSAESGVATFRSDDGIWSANAIERVCNFQTFKQYRDEVFAFYNGRKVEVDRAEPHAGHVRLAEWQERWGTHRVRLLTQNVDDLLERAGAKEVVHLHGDLLSLQCTSCDYRWRIGKAEFDPEASCPHCESLEDVKPGVVFFHENAPEYAHLIDMANHIRPRDFLVVVGTSARVVRPWEFLPDWRLPHEHNIQVNPHPEVPECYGHNLALPASHGLEVAEALFAEAMSRWP